MSQNSSPARDADSRYATELPGGSHWSLMVRRGLQLTLTDIAGGANVGMLLYNPAQLTERYNAPDTLKCQHTFRLTAGHCLYSDMGRIFCALVADSFGWHDTVCGNSHAQQVARQWGGRDYQVDRNRWHQNGYDSFLVELAKYGLSRRDMAANVNFFSQVSTDEAGKLSLSRQAAAGDAVSLRFEMDTLVVLHTCPHPLDQAAVYPERPVRVALAPADPLQEDDLCLNHCAENRRGYQNNALYHLGLPSRSA